MILLDTNVLIYASTDQTDELDLAREQFGAAQPICGGPPGRIKR
jgi:hypothetical protein